MSQAWTETPIKEIIWPDGTHTKVYMHWEHRLPNGQFNLFYPADAASNSDYRDIAAWAGYDNPIQYALEHDLTHCWLSDKLEWPYSQAIMDGANGIPVDQMSERTAYEEHMVNHIQRYLNTGELDPYGQIVEKFPQLDFSELKELYEYILSGPRFREMRSVPYRQTHSEDADRGSPAANYDGVGTTFSRVHPKSAY
jgi:hypothetical protein